MDLFDLDTVYDIEQRAHVTPWSKEILYHCMLVGYECEVFCIKENGQEHLIGYCIRRYSENFMHILNLCIDCSFQGKGYGTQLLQHCLDTIPVDRDITEIKLEVRKSNQKAIELYCSAGFKITSTLTEYYKDVSGTEDALLLIKSLHS